MNKRQKKKRIKEYWRRYNKLAEEFLNVDLTPISILLYRMEICRLRQYKPYKNMLIELKNKEVI